MYCTKISHNIQLLACFATLSSHINELDEIDFHTKMNNMPEEIFEQIREAIKTPTGSFGFEYYSKDLMDQAHSGGVLFEIVSGAHVFRLDRNKEFLLNFYHSSAGTGTRIATIDLKLVPKCEQAFILFTWSPDEINLYFGPRIKEGRLFSAKGEPCKFELCVGEDGIIYQIGDKDVDVMNVSVFQGEKQIISPTAINSWRDTKKALEILETGESKEGYVFESIVSNITISILVTGFEAYTKKRAIELEKEGVKPDITALFSDSEQKKLELYQKEAREKGLTLLQYIAEKKIINFQNYKECKRAFNKIYGIKFGSIGCESSMLKKIREFIAFRHRIIHVSALTKMLNQSRVPPEEPIFSNKKLSEEAIGIFNLFVNKLHEATLQKRN